MKITRIKLLMILGAAWLILDSTVNHFIGGVDTHYMLKDFEGYILVAFISVLANWVVKT